MVFTVPYASSYGTVPCASSNSKCKHGLRLHQSHTLHVLVGQEGSYPIQSEMKWMIWSAVQPGLLQLHCIFCEKCLDK